MKEGIHPDVPRSLLRGPVQRLQVRHPLVRADARDDQDGRRPRAAAATSSRPPASRTRSTPARKRASTRSAAGSRSSATSSRTSARRSEPRGAATKRQLRLPFLCRSRRMARVRCMMRDRLTPLPLNSPNPALVTQRAAQRLPRAGAAAVLRGLRAAGRCSGATRGRAPTSPRSATCSTSRRARRSWLAPTVGGLPADAALLPYWLGAVVHQAARALARPGAGGAHPVRAAARAGAGADLVRHLSPGAHRSGAAAAVRVRRRGRADRLRARDRRRRAARADRHARPAAARPRDHAGAGAAGRRRAVPLRARGEPVPRAAGAGSRCWSRLPVAGRQRRAEHRAWRSASSARVDLPRVELRSRRGASRRGSPPAPCCSAALRVARSAPGPGALGSYQRSAQLIGRCCGCSPGSPGRPGRSRCGRCGAGAATCSRRHIAMPARLRR